MTYSQGKRRKVLKILKKIDRGVMLESGELQAIGRYLEMRGEGNAEGTEAVPEMGREAD